MTGAPEPGRTASYLTFELGTATPTAPIAYALDIASVLQVVEPEPVAPVPLAPAAILGIMSYHGRIVTLFDPAPLLGLEAQKQSLTQVVLLRQRRTSTGTLGMKVKRASEILLTQALGAPRAEPGSCTLFVGELSGRAVHVLDAEALVDALTQTFAPLSPATHAKEHTDE
ncbi:MAG: chemotaxis protein CheW [Myxococcota bacterium]